MASFASFFMAGFECSAHRRRDGRRLDLQATTGHDRLAKSDFHALRKMGILSFRDGLRWHSIEITPGVYDWDNAETVLDAAHKTKSDVTWDLCHYGWPDWLDIWSEEFPIRFAAFAAEAARQITARGLQPKFCLINEISFMAWAGGEAAQFFPSAKGRGAELKRQLCRAAIEAAKLIRSTTPDAVFVTAEPLISVITRSGSARVKASAATRHASQYEAADILLGRLDPDLGGNEGLLDIVGLNFYPGNQWYVEGPTIYFGHHDFQPLRLLLQEVYDRYGKPLLISETGAEASCRSSWLNYIGSEVIAAIRSGVPVLGVCIYPVLEFPGWENDRICAVGLLSQPTPSGERMVDAEFAAELLVQQSKLALEVPGSSSGVALR